MSNLREAMTDVISVDTLGHMRAADPSLRIIDVRLGGEFGTSHIPGSYNIPIATLNEHVGDLVGLDQPIVLVCQTGGRATTAHDALSTASTTGTSMFQVLEGGIAAWGSAGGELVVGERQRWAMDRQVRLVAGSLVALGVLSSIAVPRAKWLAGAVGGGLFYSAVSNTCTMANVLGRLPYNQGDDCDIEGVLQELRLAS